MGWACRSKRERPRLQEIPLETVWPVLKPEVYVTMSPGQWDSLLNGFYDAGGILLEVDEEEKPLRAFQRTVQ